MLRALGFVVLGLVVVCGGYLLVFRHSAAKVRAFCDSVTIGAKVADLPLTASQYGLKLSGPVEQMGTQGKYVAASAGSPYTVSDYACRIRGTALNGTVTGKKVGY